MKKNKLIFMQVFIAFVLICTSVYATISTTIGISVSSSNVKRGEQVVVTLSLKDVDSSKAVESIEGYINYNSNIIEEIDVNSIQKSSDNTVTIANETYDVEDLTNVDINNLPQTTAYVAFNGNPASENDSKIVIDFKTPIKEDTDLLKINFKVKSDATIGEIKKAISYEMFVIASGTEQSEEITENIDLNVSAVEDDDNKNVNNNTNSNTNNNANNNTNNNKNNNTNNNNTNNNKNNNTNNNKNNSTNNNKNNSTNKNTNNNTNANNTVNIANKSLPATGAKVVILPAIVLIAVAYISYNKYVKYKDL